MYKVIVVDDEHNIRRGIVELIDWELLGCIVKAECSNGREAYEFILNNQVDIVVTDIKMSLLNGLELSDKINKNFPNIAVIVLTVYSDFEFAREALRYGVKDFIIKNTFIESLPKALRRIVSILNQKKGYDKMPSFKGKLSDRVLRDLFENLIFKDFKIDITVEAKHFFNTIQYYICSFEIFSINSGYQPKIQMDVMIDQLLPIAFEGMHFYKIFSGGYNLIILSSHQDEKISQSLIAKYFSALLKMWKDLSNSVLKMGISRKYNDIGYLKDAFTESQKALALLADTISEYSFYLNNTQSEYLLDIHKYKVMICDSLVMAKVNKAISILLEVKTCMKKSELNLEKSKMELLVILSYIMGILDTRFKGIDVRLLEESLYNEVTNKKTLFSLFETGIFTIQKIGNLIESQRKLQNNTINRVTDYLYDNYMKNIKLCDVSRDLGVSITYLSRIYKRETGVNLTSAINILKVEKAKELLTDKAQFKIYEIGEKVGIFDAGYFTNIFKKYTGCSPSEYRMNKKVGY